MSRAVQKCDNYNILNANKFYFKENEVHESVINRREESIGYTAQCTTIITRHISRVQVPSLQGFVLLCSCSYTRL